MPESRPTGAGTLDAALAQQVRGGHLHAALLAKEKLRALPVDEAFAEYARAMGYGPDTRLRRVRARSMQAVARERARFYLETAPGGEPVVCRAPRIVNHGNERDLHFRSRTHYLACFADARIRSRSHAIELGDEVLLDFEDWELATLEDRLELDPALFRSEGDTVWIVDEAAPTVVRVERAFMLTGFHTRAFGHWMWEYLPKYLSALDTSRLPPLTVLVDEDMPATHREILQAVLPPGSDVLQVDTFAHVEARELWCAPTMCYMPHSPVEDERFRLDIYAGPPERFLPVMRRLIAAFPDGPEPAPTGERVFLARRGGHRRLLNTEAIESLLVQRGFSIVEPQHLTFAQQVATIRSARHVVAPEGSALYLLFLAREDTRVAILNHEDNGGQTGFTAIVEARGLEVTIFHGPRARRHARWPHFSDYSIDEAQFESFLDDWLARGSKNHD